MVAEELDVALLGVFDVMEVLGMARMAIFEDGTLLRVLPGEPMAVWPMETVEYLLVEEYAPAPGAMRIRLRTTAGREVRLRGEMPGESLLTLLRLEERLLLR